MATAQAEFSAEPSSVGDARRFLRRTLIEWEADDLEYAAALVLTELATNSVIHTHSGFVVELTLADRALRVAVSDHSTRAPVVKTHSSQATTGRGLQLVAACAESWGFERHSDGKTVWATLPAEDHGVTVDDGPDDIHRNETKAGPDEPRRTTQSSDQGPRGGRTFEAAA